VTGNGLGTERRGRRRWRIALLCVLLTAVGAAAALIGQHVAGRGRPDASPPSAPAAATVQIVQETLVEAVTVPGRLDFGTATPVAVPGAGTVTWLPPIGAPVKRGQALLRIDEQPVVLLYGSIPMYRPLELDVRGPDVEQFERNLRALGYVGFDVDETFTEGTEAAVKRWQRWMGRGATGTVRPGEVVFTRSAIRVAEHVARLGAVNAADALTYTAVDKVVTVDAKAAQADWARKGRKVEVALPNRKKVAGTVSAVSAAATVAGGGATPAPGTGAGAAGEATVAVTVTLRDQTAVRGYERGPVDVRYVVDERSDVLTVPVTALLALTEGGYGLEVVENGDSSIVAVKVGMFTEARVEVSAPELRPGLIVSMGS
jgi:peptidoglycan hydrolase-like protein with peptidoglycan-binding domain